MTPQDVADTWESYPAEVDGAPASFFFNTDLMERTPVTGASHLYTIQIPMKHPGTHGMGTGDEARRFGPFEDEFTTAAAAAGLFFCGRIRTAGQWRLTLYGPTGADIEGLVASAGSAPRGIDVELANRDDPGWSFFRESILPDRERWQWIMDRRVVMQLEHHGDDISQARTIDHMVFVPEDAAATFVDTVSGMGFTIGSRRAEDGREGIEFQRDDPVELEHIHGVVMEVIAVAEEHGGTYDGWGAPIVPKKASSKWGKS